MLKYVDDEEYIELLGVSSIPDNFNNLVIEASNYINYNTHSRIDEDNPSEQVKYVTCLIINLIRDKEKKLSEIGSLKSQNIEGWSESYYSPEEIEKDFTKSEMEILKKYLSDEIGTDGLPLLYSGVR